MRFTCIWGSLCRRTLILSGPAHWATLTLYTLIIKMYGYLKKYKILPLVFSVYSLVLVPFSTQFNVAQLSIEINEKQSKI